MKETELKRIAEALREENKSKDRAWVQAEIRRKYLKTIKQPDCAPDIFELVEYVDVLKIRNNSLRYSYPAHYFAGFFWTFRGTNLPAPVPGFLEIPLSKTPPHMSNAELRGLRGVYAVSVDEVDLATFEKTTKEEALE